jgi:hypothetical protein
MTFMPAPGSFCETFLAQHLPPFLIRPLKGGNAMRKSKKSATDPRPIVPFPKQAGGLGGENPRHETAGCPTGLADTEQEIIAGQPGGGGAPATGANPSAPPSPGEGVTEEQVDKSGLDDG